MFEFDRELERLCFLRDCISSRWSDDTTISTSEPIFPGDLAVRNERGTFVGPRLEALVAAHGLRVNPRKTRLAEQNQRQMVTGLIVNDRVNIPREYVRKLRRQLHEWRTRGLEAASKRFNEWRSGFEDYRAVLFGGIQYVGTVRGFNDPLYAALLREFTRLQARDLPLQPFFPPAASAPQP